MKKKKAICECCFGTNEVFNGKKIIPCPSKCDNGYVEINDDDDVY